MKKFECEVVQKIIEADKEGTKEVQITVSRNLIDEASKPWLEEHIPETLHWYGIVYDWIKLEFVYE